VRIQLARLRSRGGTLGDVETDLRAAQTLLAESAERPHRT
jgi:hypothetical protein